MSEHIINSECIACGKTFKQDCSPPRLKECGDCREKRYELEDKEIS